MLYILFFVFCVIIFPIIVFLILHFASKEETDDDMSPAEHTEVCAFCQKDFPFNQLLEKEVGTYGKLYCFCKECVEELYNEFREKTGMTTGE